MLGDGPPSIAWCRSPDGRTALDYAEKLNQRPGTKWATNMKITSDTD